MPCFSLRTHGDRRFLELRGKVLDATTDYNLEPGVWVPGVIIAA